jgi:hypothetical protein
MLAAWRAGKAQLSRGPRRGLSLVAASRSRTYATKPLAGERHDHETIRLRCTSSMSNQMCTDVRIRVATLVVV